MHDQSKKEHKEKKKHKHKRHKGDHVHEINKESKDHTESGNFTQIQHVESLGIQDSNKLREQLGLAPLKVDSKNFEERKDGNKQYTIQGQTFVHLPPTNMSKIKSAKLLEEKLHLRKEKRKIEDRLKHFKTLGESDEDDSAISWVKKTRQMEKEKELAAKKAKMLEELDEEFGIGTLVDAHVLNDQQLINKGYTSENLKGLEIQHSLDAFERGRSVILTLADQDILKEMEEGANDTHAILQNVNMLDQEKAEMNIKLRKTRPDYKPYDDGMFVEGAELPIDKSVLDKYDEEIGGAAKKESFVLGDDGYVDVINMNRVKQESIDKFKKERNIQDLQTAPLTVAREYFTHEELASFKKSKKKNKKYRPKDSTTENTDTLENNGETIMERSDGDSHQGRPMDSEQLLDVIKLEEENSQLELEEVIKKARKKANETKTKGPDKVVELMQKCVTETTDTSDANQSITLNTTSEFCRALGKIPTYGTSGNRENNPGEILEFEGHSDSDASMDEEIVQNDGIETKPQKSNRGSQQTDSITQEPNIEKGLATALNLVIAKGYVDKEIKDAEMSAEYLDLKSKRFMVEDKHFDIDDKHSRRDRYSTGLLSEFKEKKDYRPDIKLDYIDDQGRVLNTKEAFRYMSHKFHGKGSGKNKIEKRTKKLVEERMLHQIKSSDTPLNTVNKLWDKQKEVKTPYLVLSGKNAH